MKDAAAVGAYPFQAASWTDPLQLRTNKGHLKGPEGSRKGLWAQTRVQTEPDICKVPVNVHYFSG